MGGGDVNVPPPSPEERALQQEQVELLRQQRDVLAEDRRVQNLLSPFLFESAGVTPQFDPEDPSRIIGFEPVEDPNQALREDIETQFLERSQAALAGKLPINPALLRDLEEQEEDLRQFIIDQLGPGGLTSTPGIEKMAEFKERSNILKEGARRADLTLAEQLGLAREQANDLRVQNLIGRTTGINQASLPLTQASLGVAQGFNSPLSHLLNQRSLELQAQQFNAQAGGGIGSIFGTLAGAFAGGAGAGFGVNAFKDIFNSSGID